MKILTKAQQIAVRIHDVASMRYHIDYENRLLSDSLDKELAVAKKNNFFKKPNHYVLQELRERMDNLRKIKEILSEYEDILQKEYDQENPNPKPYESN